MARTPSHKARALGYIAGLVAEDHAAGGCALPPLRVLAADAGVAVNTMRSAIAQLVQTGSLTRTPAGKYVPSSESGAHGMLTQLTTPPSAADPKWQHVADAIARDVITGSFSPTRPLPSAKELAARYQASSMTVRKAQESLCRKGVLVRRAKRYTVPPFAASPRNNRVVLIARGHYARATGAQVTQFTSNTLELIRTLEQECAERDLTLDIVPFHYRPGDVRMIGEREVSKALETMAADDSILGYLLSLYSIRGSEASAMLAALLSHGRPVAVSGDHEKYVDLAVQSNERVGQSFAPVDDYRCGHTVGSMLAAWGHRRIAYISIHERSPWARRRLEGLRDAVRIATDGAGTVVDFVQQPSSTVLDTGLLRVEAILGKTALDGPPGTEHLCGYIHRSMVADANHVWVSAVREEERESLEPLLGRALEADTTAWVAANDSVALSCLRFLRERGTRVPRDMSLVGFDDLGESTTVGLTTYNFNPSALAHAMISHIIRPDYKPRSMKRPTVIDGYVKVRRSAGRVRGDG